MNKIKNTKWMNISEKYPKESRKIIGKFGDVQEVYLSFNKSN